MSRLVPLTVAFESSLTVETCSFCIVQEVESGENGNALYSVAAMQGWRTEMVRHGSRFGHGPLLAVL